MVGEGGRKEPGAWQGTDAAGGFPRTDVVCARPLQFGSTQGKHSQLSNRQLAIRCATRLGRRYSFGHQRRSVAGATIRQFDQGTESGTRLREVESVSP